MNTPILTIAIPTYNRADILNNTLQKLFSDKSFDSSKIEVIVSDNASTDQTKEIVKAYPKVKYFCNSTNVGFANFTIIMGYATGKYVRLMNDTASFNPNMIAKILDTIQASDCTKENLYFVNELIQHKKGTFITKDKNQFIETLSYFITWIGNFGIWRQDFENIQNKNTWEKSLMQHVDWAIKMADNGKKTKIIVDNYLSVLTTKNKGSYNIFDVFINKYLEILKYHQIGFWTIRKEKYKLYKHFILHWYFLLQKDKEYTFDISGYNIIYKRYWYELYFLPLMLLKKLYIKIKKKR